MVEVAIEGTITIDDAVVAGVASEAAEEVEGVHAIGTPSVTRAVAEALGAARPETRGVGVQVGRTEAAFDLAISVERGYSIPNVASQVKQRVSERVLEICGLTAKRVNIRVTNIEKAVHETHAGPYKESKKEDLR